MSKVRWIAPKSIYKQLDTLSDQIQNSIKQRKSKSFHNMFTTNKKLDIELNKQLESPVQNVSILLCHYGADSNFATLCSQLDKVLQSNKKSCGINVSIKVPNTTPHYQIIQKNVEKLDKRRQNLESLRNNQLQSIRTCIQTCQEKFDKESKDSRKNYDHLNKNSQTLLTQFSEIEKRNKSIISLTVSLTKDATKEREKIQSFVINWKNAYQTFLRYFNEYKTTSGFFTSAIVTELENIYKINKKMFNTQLALLNNSISNVVMLCAGQDKWDSIASLSSSLAQEAEKYSPPTFDETPYNNKSLITAGQNSDRLGIIISKADGTFLYLSKTYTQICTLCDNFQLLLKSDDQSVYIQKNINEAVEIQKSLESQINTQIQIIQEGMAIYEKNLNRSIDVHKKNSENIDAHLKELKTKNKTVLQYKSSLTITQGIHSQYFTREENEQIANFTKYIQTWIPDYNRFIEASTDFSTKLSNYNASAIIDELRKKIQVIRKESSDLLTPLEKLISTCNELLSEKKYEDARSTSEKLSKQAQNFKFTSKFDPKKIDQEASEIIDKPSELLSHLKDEIEKNYSTLSVTFNNMSALHVRVQKFQVSLQTRINCQNIFAFDKHASSMDENNAKNLERRHDTSKLQSVFDIVFNGKNIEKQNTAPYIPFTQSAAWILIDNKGDDFKEPRLKMPYTKKDDFQKDLIVLYSK